jgi:hypothetical protein
MLTGYSGILHPRTRLVTLAAGSPPSLRRLAPRAPLGPRSPETPKHPETQRLGTMKGSQSPRSSAEGSHVDRFVESRSSRHYPKRGWYKVARSGIRWETPYPAILTIRPHLLPVDCTASLSARLAFDVKTMCYKAAYAMPACAVNYPNLPHTMNLGPRQSTVR